MTGRVLFHVQHLLGIGHLQRSLRIAEALAARGIAVTLVQGGPPVPVLDAVRRHRNCPAAADSRPRRHLRPGRWRRPAGRRRAARGASRPAARRLRRNPAGCGGDRGVSVRPPRLPLRARSADRGGARGRARRSSARCATSRPCATIPPATPRSSPAFAPISHAVLVHGDPGFIPFEVPFPPARADRRPPALHRLCDAAG